MNYVSNVFQQGEGGKDDDERFGETARRASRYFFYTGIWGG